MLSKQYKKACFMNEQYLTEERRQDFGSYYVEYVFKNVHDYYDTNTVIVTDADCAYVFWRVDENYTCYNSEDLDDPDTEDTEDIFDAYSFDICQNLNKAIISVMHDCPDEDEFFRPNFNTYSEMISFYEKMKEEGLVSNIEEFLTEQICDDFKQDLESTLAAYNAGVPLEDILVDD